SNIKLNGQGRHVNTTTTEVNNTTDVGSLTCFTSESYSEDCNETDLSSEFGSESESDESTGAIDEDPEV
ncbi:unnamed protein product, partial [Allacma fusca]